MAKRIMDVYWDVVAGLHRDSAGTELRPESYPFIVYREQPILNLRLVIDGANGQYTGLGPTGVYALVIDTDFDESTGNMAKTEGTDVNTPGDWEGGGTADPTQGQISGKMNAFTARYKEAVGTNRQVEAWLELLQFDGTGIIEAIHQIPIIAKNVVDDGGGVPPPAPVTANTWGREFTDPVTGKKYVRWYNSDGEELETMTPPGVDL